VMLHRLPGRSIRTDVADITLPAAVCHLSHRRVSSQRSYPAVTQDWRNPPFPGRSRTNKTRVIIPTFLRFPSATDLTTACSCRNLGQLGTSQQFDAGSHCPNSRLPLLPLLCRHSCR
jgi:hypothetical protein